MAMPRHSAAFDKGAACHTWQRQPFEQKGGAAPIIASCYVRSCLLLGAPGLANSAPSSTARSP